MDNESSITMSTWGLSRSASSPSAAWSIVQRVHDELRADRQVLPLLAHEVDVRRCERGIVERHLSPPDDRSDPCRMGQPDEPVTGAVMAVDPERIETHRPPDDLARRERPRQRDLDSPVV